MLDAKISLISVERPIDANPPLKPASFKARSTAFKKAFACPPSIPLSTSAWCPGTFVLGLGDDVAASVRTRGAAFFKLALELEIEADVFKLCDALLDVTKEPSLTAFIIEVETEALSNVD